MLKSSKQDDGESGPNSLSLGFIEELYAAYQQDPASVSADWRRYFKGLGGRAGALEISKRVTAKLQDEERMSTKQLFEKIMAGA